MKGKPESGRGKTSAENPEPKSVKNIKKNRHVPVCST